jgi:hypothetical protein
MLVTLLFGLSLFSLLLSAEESSLSDGLILPEEDSSEVFLAPNLDESSEGPVYQPPGESSGEYIPTLSDIYAQLSGASLETASTSSSGGSSQQQSPSTGMESEVVVIAFCVGAVIFFALSVLIVKKTK